MVPGVSAGVVGVFTVVPGVSTVVLGVSTDGAVVSAGVSVATDASDSREDAALVRMDECSEAKELRTPESVAVADTLENSSLRDDAILSNAAGVVVALADCGVGAAPESVVKMLPIPPVTSEAADVRPSPDRIGEVAEGSPVGRIPPRPVSDVRVSLESEVDSSEGTGTSGMIGVVSLALALGPRGSVVGTVRGRVGVGSVGTPTPRPVAEPL